VDLEGIGMIDQPVTGQDMRAGDLPFASMGDLGLDKRKVTQCALSRICGVCAGSLGRPVAFLGTVEEAGRNEFHFPPSHVTCAEAALEVWGGVSSSAALGHPATPETWVLVTTSGFEYVRPTSEWEDRRAVFSPNSMIEERRLTLA
jgi:hypothetical protein